MGKNPAIFINYRQDESSLFVHYLRNYLAAHLPDDSIFLDTESIAKGEAIGETLWQHMEAAEILLVVAGPNWHTCRDAENDRRLANPKDWVRCEIERAKQLNKPIWLVLHNQVDFKEAGDWLLRKLPSLAFLSEINYVSCFDKSIKKDLAALLEDLKALPNLPFLSKKKTPATKLEVPSYQTELALHYPLPEQYHVPQAEAPFMGLKYFQKEDARLFFGRTREILDLCRAIEQFPLILLYGQSGVGKSSLLQAGFLPRIETRFQPHYIRRKKTDPQTGEDLGLHKQIQEYLTHDLKKDKPSLLILDQVEEMYTNSIANRQKEVTRFAELLQKIRDQQPACKVLVSFRSEHYAPLRKLFLAGRFILTEDQECYLQALDWEGVKEAIGGLNDQKNQDIRNHYQLRIEPDLVHRMATDLLQPQRSESHIAPLLQYQLRNLWDKGLETRATDHDWITLSLEVYQAQRKSSLQELLAEQLKSLSQRLPAWEPYLQNGLIWDLLWGYTTPQLTAAEQGDEKLLEAYSHIPDFPQLFAVLKHHCYLMIPCGTQHRPATRLAHDALAPLIRELFTDSDDAGQRAGRIVETKMREIRAGKRTEFSETDLLTIEEGLMGMQKLPPEIEQRMQRDRQRYLQERESRFRLAMEVAQRHYEHLEYEQSLAKLAIAAKETLHLEQVHDLAQQLPYVFLQLELQEQWIKSLEFLLKLPPADQALASLKEDPHQFPTLAPALYQQMEQRYFPHMLTISGGSFQMGSEEGYADEKPVHRVSVSDFEMASTPLTCWQFGLFCLDTGRENLPNDSGFGRANHPIINVSWFDAIDYCNWLSQRHDLMPVYEKIDAETVICNWERDGYRLPTEAEWEYAAREGGKNVRFGNGKDRAHPDEINYDFAHPYNDKPYIEQTDRKGLGKTTPVGTYPANALGLYDMSGNVYEWCWDRWSEGSSSYYHTSEGKKNPYGPEDSYEARRLVRGGSWYLPAVGCRAAYRVRLHPIFRDDLVGFRVVRRLTL